MPGITKPVSRLLKLYRECTSELFKQLSNDFNPGAALQQNGGICAGMQTIQQAAVNRNQTSSPPASAARLRVTLHHASSTSPSSSKRSLGSAQLCYNHLSPQPTAKALSWIHTHVYMHTHKFIYTYIYTQIQMQTDTQIWKERESLYHFSYILLAIFKPWSVDCMKSVHKQQLRKARLLTTFKSLCRLLPWAPQHPQRVNPVHTWFWHGQFLISNDVMYFAGNPAKIRLHIYKNIYTHTNYEIQATY